ncbi:MAG: hypothetical protein LPK19_01725 [Hymenobacteraceae bacterium]|mgnify:CR=1 FL=1|nr:hypothetical protein [Hymenobacteraceae bacterium]MDX5394893.1 hypothetical protein [Hymenobacteraceae bacterium]MDX5510929.1 hypothetical protein [Hymenobacteraceae bacterium]
MAKQESKDEDKRIITNTDENRQLPEENPEPLKETMKSDEFDQEPEGKEQEGNVAAKTESQTRKLDGSNANNLRTK